MFDPKPTSTMTISRCRLLGLGAMADVAQFLKPAQNFEAV